MDVATKQQETSVIESNRVIDYINELIVNAEGSSISDSKAELAVGCRYEHTFTPGIYVRKMFIPKDVIIVTMIHKTEHPYFIMQGDVSVFKDGEMVRIVAPYQGVTEVGTRRALRAHEDTIWITVHATNKTDLEEIIKDSCCRTVEEFNQWKIEQGEQKTEDML